MNFYIVHVKFKISSKTRYQVNCQPQKGNLQIDAHPNASPNHHHHNFPQLSNWIGHQHHTPETFAFYANVNFSCSQFQEIFSYMCQSHLLPRRRGGKSHTKVKRGWFIVWMRPVWMRSFLRSSRGAHIFPRKQWLDFEFLGKNHTGLVGKQKWKVNKERCVSVCDEFDRFCMGNNCELG